MHAEPQRSVPRAHIKGNVNVVRGTLSGQGVDDGEQPGDPVHEDDAAVAAVDDAPAEGRIARATVGLQEGSEEEVSAADGREHVPVAAVGGDEGREGIAVGILEDPEEGRRVELAEAAAEGRGGGHRAAPRPACEGGADERREGGEAEEDGEEEVLAEGFDGGGGARLLWGFRRRRLGWITAAGHGDERTEFSLKLLKKSFF